MRDALRVVLAPPREPAVQTEQARVVLGEATERVGDPVGLALERGVGLSVALLVDVGHGRW